MTLKQKYQHLRSRGFGIVILLNFKYFPLYLFVFNLNTQIIIVYIGLASVSTTALYNLQGKE